MELSIIIPMESNRIDFLRSTLDKYIEAGLKEPYEILIISKTIALFEHKEMNINTIVYQSEDKFFNMSVPLNIGVRNSKYNNIIITSPEVTPTTNVFTQLYSLERNNYLCQVFDERPHKNIKSVSLINSKYRNDCPGYCFFALYKKEDILKINGWSEAFRNCQGYEDKDFGRRLKLSGATYKVLDDIQLLHRFHERTINKEATQLGKKTYLDRMKRGIIK